MIFCVGVAGRGDGGVDRVRRGVCPGCDALGRGGGVRGLDRGEADKTGRLAVIVGQVLADFRTGLSANPNMPVDEDETKLEIRCVPHALATVVYNLMMEMGLSVNMSGMTAFNNAQVYLRRLYTSDEVLSGAVSATPSYRASGAVASWQ